VALEVLSKMAVWQDDETAKLLELWGEENMQASL